MAGSQQKFARDLEWECGLLISAANQDYLAEFGQSRDKQQRSRDSFPSDQNTV